MEAESLRKHDLLTIAGLEVDIACYLAISCLRSEILAIAEALAVELSLELDFPELFGWLGIGGQGGGAAGASMMAVRR